jgi:hypothetical protein
MTPADLFGMLQRVQAALVVVGGMVGIGLCMCCWASWGRR